LLSESFAWCLSGFICSEFIRLTLAL
jgi:hypothetical protein